MAMGDPEHLPAPLPSPALGHQLLAGIKREALTPLLQLGPHVAAGPQLPDPPESAAGLAQQ